MRNSFIVIAVFMVFFSCSDDTTTGPSASLIPGMEFVTVSAGEFQMGAPEDEFESSADERPLHPVTFSYSFQIMTTEVTQGMWEEVMGSIPPQENGLGSDFPVYNVSWQQCQDFISEMNNLDSDFYYRLPSESEWEYCCRAGTSTRYYWGDDLYDPSNITNFAWGGFGAGGDTHPVSGKRPNDWGLYDMIGNVSEWCQDWSHFNYEGAPSDGEAWENPATQDRIFRGGSFRSPSPGCRSAFRDPANPNIGHDDIGLRL